MYRTKKNCIDQSYFDIGTGTVRYRTGNNTILIWFQYLNVLVEVNITIAYYT